MSPAEQTKAETRPVNRVGRATELATMIVGLGGLLLALLWLLGRASMSGYYEAMNIPFEHVQHSVWEYSEIAALLLLVSGFLTLVILLLLGMIFLVLFEPLRQGVTGMYEVVLPGGVRPRGFDWLAGIRAGAAAQSGFRARVVRQLLRLLYVSFVGSLVLFLFIGYVSITTEAGKRLGRSAVLNEGMQVRFVSKQPFTLAPTAVISATGSLDGARLYVYDRLRLLTYNNDDYFVFEEVDPMTCRPKEVYIINRGELVEVGLRPSQSIVDACKR